MSQKKYSNFLFNLTRDLIWAQWNRIGLNGTGGINRYSVDIESALIAAAYGSRLDGRLYEGVWAWLERYGVLVNAERLSTLICQQNDEWVARFLGALLQKINPSQWKGVINQCKKLCSQSWEKTPLLIHSTQKRWRSGDPVMLQWGIIYDLLSPGQKMKDHAMILRCNSLIRYRYLFGAMIRADVIYLLSISHKCQQKRELDFLTSVRLAERLSCYLSTIHRIQKDLENGGFIQSVEAARKNRSLTTWLVQDMQFLERGTDYDLGAIHWIKMNALLFALLKLTMDFETIQNETILKVHIQEFQIEYFPTLMDHKAHVPTPYGTAMGPLEKYSVNQLVDMITQPLVSFYRILCGIILIRCRKCNKVFDSPIQGNLSSLIKSDLPNNRVVCPHCSFCFLTSNPDFFYYDALGSEQTISFQGVS